MNENRNRNRFEPSEYDWEAHRPMLIEIVAPRASQGLIRRWWYMIGGAKGFLFILAAAILLWLAVALVLAIKLDAAELPDMPTPKVMPKPIAVQSAFWTRSTKIEAGVMLTLAAFDMGQTCHNLANGGHEDFLPVRSCRGAVALTAGFEAAAIGSAWLLNRTGHRKLAKVPMAFMGEQSARAILYSKKHGAW